MKVLGVDYGRARIGLAVSTELGIALPLPAVAGGAGAADAVAGVARARGVEAIVLGEPRSLSGARGPMAEEVGRFRAELEAASGLPVHLADERYTSREAARALRGEKRAMARRRDGSLDSAAATLLLAAWLEANRR